MGAHHEHDRRDAGSLNKLKLALGLTSVYMFAEAIGSWLVNSFALLPDAGHMLTDVAALSLTLRSNLVCIASGDGEKDFWLLQA